MPRCKAGDRAFILRGSNAGAVVVCDELMGDSEWLVTSEGGPLKCLRRSDGVRLLGRRGVIPDKWLKPIRGLTPGDVLREAEQRLMDALNTLEQSMAMLTRIAVANAHTIERLQRQLADRAAK